MARPGGGTVKQSWSGFLQTFRPFSLHLLFWSFATTEVFSPSPKGAYSIVFKVVPLQTQPFIKVRHFIYIVPNAKWIQEKWKVNEVKSQPKNQMDVSVVCAVITFISCHIYSNCRSHSLSILPIMSRFMLNQWISWTACGSTSITRNGDASDVISFNVFHYILHTSLLSTHLAYSWSSVF